MQKNESGIRRLVWLPKETDKTVRIISNVLGMSMSSFIRFCVLYYFEAHSIQSMKINAVKTDLIKEIERKLAEAHSLTCARV
jgi:hypothetical protein